MDIVDRRRRSLMMAKIGPRNTRPELIVRRLLHRMRFRFRLHLTALPGRPDVVLPSYRLVIFVHGCFWHRHQGCINCTMPKTRSSFWNRKFDQNVARDTRSVRALRRSGWRVITVWECETEHLLTLERRLLRLLRPGPAKTKRKRGSTGATVQRGLGRSNATW